MRNVIVLACLALLATVGGAWAAGFDCARASSAFEKIICSDSSVSALDGEMGSAYTAALEKLSPEGVRIVRTGQREWLTAARQSCPLQDWRPAKEMQEAQSSCFQQMYRERIEAIKASAVQAGPFLFSRVDSYRAVMVNDTSGSGNATRLATQQEAYPRIDRPQNEQTAALNRMLLPEHAHRGCGIHRNGSADGDRTIGYKLTFSNEKLLSITWSDWSYCFGMPHASYYTAAQNIVFVSQPRPLKPADMFRKDRGWWELLTKLGIAAVRAELRERNNTGTQLELTSDAIEAIKNTVTDVRKWSLQKDGLLVQFDPEGLNMGYAVFTGILIPWSDLKPALSTLLLE